MASKRSGARPRGSQPSQDTRNQRQMASTVQPSTSGLVIERETPYQQRGNGNLPSFAGTTVYTQNGAVGTIGPEPSRPVADIVSTHRSNREHLDLVGIGSHTFNTGNVQYDLRTAHLEEARRCPYHGPILQDRLMRPRPGQGLGPMDRYLTEDTSEQYALFYRPDTGNLSTFKGCQCIEKMQSSIDTDDYAPK